jgi:ketosteroid isomerase-like protein
MSPESLETVRLILEGSAAGVAQGDVGAAFDLGVEAGVLAADPELVPARELAGDSIYRGREGFIEFMRIWTEDFEDWAVQLERGVESTDGRVVAVLRQRGTGKGSGVPVELTHGGVFELRDGRVTRITLYLEPGDAFKAASLSE